MSTVDILHLASSARKASPALMRASSAQKDRVLHILCEALLARQEELLAANARDVEHARLQSQPEAFLDRLRLTPARIQAMVEGVRQVIALPDPVGIITGGLRRPNGLEIFRKRVPLGVVAIIFESRPNVVIDAGILCLKSGNASILKGGKEAFHSQEVLVSCLRQGLREAGLPEDACQSLATSDREAFKLLLKQDTSIDVVIPRGGENLIRSVVENSTIPVIKHFKGVCHVYVDKHADLEMALRITENAKVQRPGVCNAMETLLVHSALLETFLPQACEMLASKGVELRGCPRTQAAWPNALPASESDWAEEYLNLTLAVKVVDSLDDAIAHIETYGSRHTDAIVTRDLERARKFLDEVDSAAVMVNASTRFSDGFEFGLGAEIGISTDKLHARGPMGLESLTCEKWVVMGSGQVRR